MQCDIIYVLNATNGFQIYSFSLVTLPQVIPIRNITPIIEHITPNRYVLAGDADICATSSLTLSTGAIWKKKEQITDMYNNCMISI